jgi:hypothetical protein
LSNLTRVSIIGIKMIKNGILTLLAAVAIAMAAGCTASTDQSGPGAARKSTLGQSQAEQGSPYTQPLMATGGDLVMLRIQSRGIAGGRSGC